MVTERLSGCGFRFIGKCHCSGTPTEKYYNGDITVYLQIKRRMFRVKRDNRTIFNFAPYTELEKYLNEYKELLAQAKTRVVSA